MGDVERYQPVVDELRRLQASVQSVEADNAAVNEAAALLAQANRLLSDGEPRKAWYEVDDPDLRKGRNRDFSPWSGALNPVAPPMRFEAGERDGVACLVGRVTVSTLREGPPGVAHGGVLAGLFDEIMAAARGHELGGLAFTARLAVRYAKVTPSVDEVVFRAWVDDVRGRRVTMKADCVIAETLAEPEPTVTATAEAMFLCQ